MFFPAALLPVALLVREDVCPILVYDGDQGGELQHALVSKWPASGRATGGVVLDINEQDHPPVVNGSSLMSSPGQGT